MLVALLLVLLSLIGGALWGWYSHKRYQASPEAAIDTLNKSIAEKNWELLGTVLRARAFVTQLATAMQSNPAPIQLDEEAQKTPPAAHNADALEQQATTFLVILQELFQASEKPKPAGAFVPVLPDDTLTQLSIKPFELRNSDGSFFAETTIRLPFSTQPLPLRFLLQKTGETWQATHFISAPAIVSAYNDAVMAELVRRKEAEEQALAQNRQALAHHIPDARCVAGITRVSGDIPLLVLSVQTGLNPGPETLDGWGLVCVISDASGKVLATPHTSSTLKVPKETPIKQSWSPEISEEQYTLLQSAGPLTCQAIPEYAILNSGKILKDPRN